jgi:DNA-binding transcriptional LysR family regulator
MNTVENFRAFLAVVEVGSFSAAARRLNISASMITKRVKAVEHEIGQLVFFRSTRKLELTAIGREAVSLAREFLTAYERMVNVTGSGRRELVGSLRVKAPISFTMHFLGEVLDAFLLKHPKVNLDLKLMNRPVNPLTENFDMVITGLPDSFDGVDEVPLYPHRRIVCAAPTYLAQMGEPKHPSDLQNHRCLLTSYIAPGRVWTFKNTNIGDINVGVDGQFHTNDTEAMHAAAVSGLGIAVLPRYRVQDSLAKGKLVEILHAYALPDLWIKILRPAHHNKSVLLSSLTEHLVSNVDFIRTKHPAL